MAHDAFISYSSKDKAVADAACARLEARGVRCWIAPRDVQPGANYGASIIEAIHASKVMVLVLSGHANTSPHIPNEIERAVSHGVAVLPFRIEDVVPAKSLDLFIGSVHWLDALTPPLERHLDRLADSVHRLISREPLPPPPPVPVPGPRPSIGLLAAGAVGALAVLALVGWLAFGLGRGSSTTAVDGVAQAPPTVAPSAGVEPAPAPERPAPASVPAATRAPAPAPAPARNPVVGCWRWSNNATIVIREDGTMTAGPFTGTWRQGAGRNYGFTWPEPVDTLALSPDGARLAGGNQYGVPVIATRVSGGPEFPGVWSWGGVATVVADARGSMTLGALTGSWTLADPGQRIYRVTWPKIQDSVTLSSDGTSIQGSNQYGANVSGRRLPDCG